MQQRASDRIFELRIRKHLHRMLTALALLAAIGVSIASSARGATITVSTTSDPGGPPGTCSLRDAIAAANTKAAANNCPAGSGIDTINFSVSGTITLGSSLPAIANTSGGSLTIDGTGHTVTVDGASLYQVLIVNSGATLGLNQLTVAHGDFVAVTNHGTLNLTSTTLSGNSYAGGGAGIFNDGPTLTVANSSFSGNVSGAGCPCIANNGGSLTISNSTFAGNGNSLGGSGGAVCNSGGTLTVTNSTFSTNSAGNDAGAIYLSGGATATVNGCTFTGNTAGFGGAISNNGAILTVTNSTFYANSVGGDGGAIFNNGPALTVINSTISGNNATFFGSGICSNASVVTTVTNSILANNTFEIGGGNNCFGLSFSFITDGGYNISNDNSCGFATITAANGLSIGDNIDPRLDSAGLQNNGGPTQTIALQSTSPAIDAIPFAHQCPATDQRGRPRPDPEDGPTGPCDIGSYEFQDTVAFAGQPGQTNCKGKSLSALANQYGNLESAASSLGYPSVKALQAAVGQFCGS